MSALDAKVAAARAAGALSRRDRPRGHEPARQAADAPGAARDRPPRGPAAQRQRGHLGHQRQDDGGRDDRRDPRAHRRAARAQPRRREHGRRRRRHAAAGRRAQRHDRRRHRPVRGRRVLARPGRRASCARGRCCWATCSATSSTATASSTRSPTAGPRSRATTPARLVLCADDPTIADLGRDRADVVYYGIEDDGVARTEMQHAADAKHCRRCGAPYVYEAIYFGHLGRYHCPTGDAPRPEPQVSARDVVLEGVRGARFALHTPAGVREIVLPLPGLYNVYNALGAAALALTLGASLDDVAAGLRGRLPRVRPRRDRAHGRHRALDPARQEPGRRQRGAAHAHPGARRARRAGGAQRQHRRRARRQLGVGRGLRGARAERAPRDVRGDARGGDGAAPEVRGRGPGAHHGRRPSSTRPSTPRWRPATARVFALPTYTAMLALRELLVDAAAPCRESFA